MAETAAHASGAGRAAFDRWRSGAREPNFSGSLTVLRRHLKRPDLFDYKTGAIGLLYRNLSEFAHARPGSTNVDIWESNGPLWVPEAFEAFQGTFSDTMAACYLLAKIAWPELQLPDAARVLFGPSSDRWRNLGADVLKTFFSL